MTDEQQHDEHPASGWEQWSKYVLLTLERFDTKLERIDGNQRQLQAEITVLKTKLALYAAFSGLVIAIVAETAKHFLVK